MTATDELQALLDKATALNGETFAQTVDRIICEHSAWIGCPNKQIAEKIAFSALVRASAITERADSEEVTALIAEVERLRELAHDMLLDLEGTRIFLVTREKMHECGVAMRDEIISRARVVLQVQP